MIILKIHISPRLRRETCGVSLPVNEQALTRETVLLTEIADCLATCSFSRNYSRVVIREELLVLQSQQLQCAGGMMHIAPRIVGPDCPPPPLGWNGTESTITEATY
jgi:hypothetical protein